jgi:HPt (histidine-containing phosphotransfer) domain-containing protein
VNEADAPLLDAAVLDELTASVGGDRAFVGQLIETYLADSAAHLDEVEQAVAADDAAALVRPAHTLKSSSATLGAQRVAAQARSLEVTARSGAVDDDAREVAAALRPTWEETTQALRSWTAGS